MPSSPHSELDRSLFCNAGDDRQGRSAGSLGRTRKAGRESASFAFAGPSSCESKTRTPHATRREEQRAERA